jgi:glycosyltransferase involved in cell wall biosynthesis
MSDTKPRVSIGFPVYNGEKFMRSALDSILEQTFTDFEIIIADNASTDTTEIIAREYAEKDSRIRYYRNEKNLGATRNYNLSFELARGEYFRWAAHDDVLAPTNLERCVEILDNHPSVILAYPRTMIIDGEGNHVSEYYDGLHLRAAKPHERFREYHYRFQFSDGECNAVFGLMRTRVLGKTPLIGGFVSSDKILLGELALLGEFYEIPEFLFYRRDHVHTSVRANRAFRDRVAWFDPSKKGKLQMNRWIWLSEYVAAINRVQMDRTERVRCYAQMEQWVVWHSKYLAKDVVKAVIWPLYAGLSRNQRVLNWKTKGGQ